MENEDSGKKYEIKLTNEQQDSLKEIFGEDITSLKFAVEEFSNSSSRDGATLRVLKVDNVAVVLHSGKALAEPMN